jgi:hypothetical protein
MEVSDSTFVRKYESTFEGTGTKVLSYDLGEGLPSI